MSNVIPFPSSHIDQHVSEALALAQMMISLGENADDHEYARLRPSLVSTLYIVCDKLIQANSFLPAIKGAAQ